MRNPLSPLKCLQTFALSYNAAPRALQKNFKLQLRLPKSSKSDLPMGEHFVYRELSLLFIAQALLVFLNTTLTNPQPAFFPLS